MKANFLRYSVSVIIACMAAASSNAQVAGYSFSQSVGTFNSISGTGTPAGFGTGWDDAVSGAIDIGFPFNYNGVSYTQCYINTNGAVEFTNPNDNRFQPYLQNSVANAVMVMGEDLNDNTTPGSDILYTVTGSQPNRIFTVEFSHCRRYNLTGEDLNMQVRLLENNNVCEVVYGAMTFAASTNNCQVGLSGNLPNPITDYNIRTTANDWTATTAGTSNADNMPTGSGVILPSGLTFDWQELPCNGAPTAGTLSATQETGCTPYAAYLSFNNTPSGSGITYQYQSSADSINWSNINGATNALDTVNVTAPIYIRAYVICTNSGLADTTGSVFLNFQPEVTGTASLPYFQGFENWTGTCYSFDRPDTNWQNTPVYGDDSWRRDDEGTDAGWEDEPDGLYSPVSNEAAHSARFHSYYADEGTTGDLDLHINLSAAGTKNINFDYINTNGDDFLNVQLSEDGGATFTTLGTVTTAGAWTPVLFTTTSVAANAIIRFDAVSDFGGTDIGFDSLSVSLAIPTCTAPANLTASNGNATSILLSWTAIPGAAGYEYTVDQTAADPIVPGTATTNSSVTVTGLTPATVYYAHVRTDCSGGDTSPWVTVSFTTGDTCLAPTNLTATNITSTSADVSWTAVGGATAYQYTLDQVATAPTVPGTVINGTTYSATGLIAGGTYYFHLRTECNNNADSSGWVTLTINLLPEGVDNVAGNGFGITASPNPTNGIINLIVNGGSTGKAIIMVTDIVGKVVIPQTNVTGNKMQLDMSQLTPGTYFVNYNDNEHKQTIKVNKQ